MQKAFLFDMDGVIVDSEAKWTTDGIVFMQKLYGEEIAAAIGETTGMTLEPQYQLAKQRGFTMELDEFYRRYDEHAAKMYEDTVITQGLEELVDFLKSQQFSIGIVSSSRRPWVNTVLQKIERTDLFDYILSLNEKGLPSKPSPEGFIRAMQDIGSSPETTIILEDSNAGITSAKMSGAFTIAFTPLLTRGYKQIPADAKAHSFKDVEGIVKEKSLT